MKASNTEIYNAIHSGGTLFSIQDKLMLALAIERADTDPMEIVSVGRLFIEMAKGAIERERTRYSLTEKGIDEVDALRCGGVL